MWHCWGMLVVVWPCVCVLDGSALAGSLPGGVCWAWALLCYSYSLYSPCYGREQCVCSIGGCCTGNRELVKCRGAVQALVTRLVLWAVRVQALAGGAPGCWWRCWCWRWCVCARALCACMSTSSSFVSGERDSAWERNFETECITCMHAMLVVPEHLQTGSVCGDWSR